MQIMTRKFILLFLLLSITGLNCRPVFARDHALPEYAQNLLAKLQDEKITVKTRSGEKVEGVLWDVTEDHIQLEKKDGTVANLAFADIQDIRKSGSVGSFVGGVFTGILVGTGAVFTFFLAGYIIGSIL